VPAPNKWRLTLSSEATKEPAMPGTDSSRLRPRGTAIAAQSVIVTAVEFLQLPRLDRNPWRPVDPAGDPDAVGSQPAVAPAVLPIRPGVPPGQPAAAAAAAMAAAIRQNLSLPGSVSADVPVHLLIADRRANDL
jgi:hypothetical protein